MFLFFCLSCSRKMNGTCEYGRLLSLKTFTLDRRFILKLFLFFSTGTGSCVDSLSHNCGATFSTKDKDSDYWAGNCAVNHQGAWWYNRCTQTNLNGLYSPTAGYEITGIYWYRRLPNTIVLLKRAEMMLELVK